MQLSSLFTFLGMNASSGADVDAHSGAEQNSSGFGAMLSSTLAMLTQKSGSDLNEEAGPGGRDNPNTGPGEQDDTRAQSSDLSARLKQSDDSGIGPLLSPGTGTGVDERHRHATSTGEGNGADDELLKRSAGSGSGSADDHISADQLARPARHASDSETAIQARPDGSAEKAAGSPHVDAKILIETQSETSDSSIPLDDSARNASSGDETPSDAELQVPEQDTKPANDTLADKRRGSASGAAADEIPSAGDVLADGDSSSAGDTQLEGDGPAVGNRPLQGSDPSAPTAGSMEDAEAAHVQPRNDASSDDVLRPNSSVGDASDDDAVYGRDTDDGTSAASTAKAPSADPDTPEADLSTPAKFADDAHPVQRDAGSSSRRDDVAAESDLRTSAADRQRGAAGEANRQHVAAGQQGAPDETERQTGQSERFRAADVEWALHRRMSIRQEPATSTSFDAEAGTPSPDDQISAERLARHASGSETAPPARPDGSAEKAAGSPPADVKILIETPSETPDSNISSDDSARNASSAVDTPSDAELQVPEQNTKPANDTHADKRRGSAAGVPADDIPSAGDGENSTASDALSEGDELSAGDPPSEGDGPAVGNRPLQGSDPSAPTAGTMEDAEAADIQPRTDALSDDDLRPNTSAGDASSDDSLNGRGAENRTEPASSAKATSADPETPEADLPTPAKFDDDADPVQRDAGPSARRDVAAESNLRTFAADRHPGATGEANRQQSATGEANRQQSATGEAAGQQSGPDDAARQTEQTEHLRAADLERALHRRISVRQEPATAASSDEDAGTSATDRAADTKSAASNRTATDAETESDALRTAGIPDAASERKSHNGPNGSESKADPKTGPTTDSKVGVRIDVRDVPDPVSKSDAPESPVKDGARAAADSVRHSTEPSRATAQTPPPSLREGSHIETLTEDAGTNAQNASSETLDAGTSANGDGGSRDDFMGRSGGQPRDAFDVAAEQLSPDAPNFDATLQGETQTVDAEVPVDVQSAESTEKMNFTPERAHSTASPHQLSEADRTARPRQSGSLSWMRSMLEDSLSGLSLEDDWKVLEMKLDEGQGTMTVRARRDEDKVTISVNFTDPQLRAMAIEQTDRLQETLRAQYSMQVDFSLMNDNTGHSQHGKDDTGRGGGRSAEALPSTRAHAVSSADRARATRAALVGARNEWIG